jgi:hypothetical protein
MTEPEKKAMYSTDRATYSPADFLLWQDNGILDITPKFQRRSVWRTAARSYFIDTILRGMTIPPIYLRITQNKDKTKALRQVVDGQQRVRSVLDFINEEFKLVKSPDAPWAGKWFGELSEDQQQQIRDFGFPAEIFKGISDQQVLEVFCRLNMNGVQLNRQELRNGKYFGFFKQACYDTALKYLEFWRKHSIFSEQNIARMLEVELTSELLIAESKGMQDKKSSIDDFYKDWESEYPHENREKKRLETTMEQISETLDEDLSDSEFHRPPLFYTLYCVVFHHTFGLPQIQRPSPRKTLGAIQRESLRDAVLSLSEAIVRSKDPTEKISRRYARFIGACQRQTDNLIPRKIRFDGLFDEAF